MSKKVLGFYEEDAGRVFDAVESGKEYEIAAADLVPVVSKEEHEEALQYWKDKWFKQLKNSKYYRTLYHGCKKRLKDLQEKKVKKK